jgi:hypothetical protein
MHVPTPELIRTRKAYPCSGQKQRKHNPAIGYSKPAVRKATRSSRTKCIRTDPTGVLTAITTSIDQERRFGVMLRK